MHVKYLCFFPLFFLNITCCMEKLYELSSSLSDYVPDGSTISRIRRSIGPANSPEQEDAMIGIGNPEQDKDEIDKTINEIYDPFQRSLKKMVKGDTGPNTNNANSAKTIKQIVKRFRISLTRLAEIQSELKVLKEQPLQDNLHLELIENTQLFINAKRVYLLNFRRFPQDVQIAYASALMDIAKLIPGTKDVLIEEIRAKQEEQRISLLQLAENNEDTLQIFFGDND